MPKKIETEAMAPVPKWIFFALFASSISILSLVLSAFLAVKIISEIKHPTTSQNTISVSGEGKVFAVPDIGKVSFSVTKSAPSVESAQSEMIEGVNSVIASLKSQGVAENDIKTTGYSVYPRYDYIDGERVSKGYEASQSMEVKIRDIDSSGIIISEAVSAGATQAGGLAFIIDDESSIKQEARKKAIDDAKKKAHVLARDLGVRLDDIVSFSESGGGYPVFYEKAMTAGVGGAEIPEMPVGENEVISRVTIVFEIK